MSGIESFNIEPLFNEIMFIRDRSIDYEYADPAPSDIRNSFRNIYNWWNKYQQDKVLPQINQSLPVNMNDVVAQIGIIISKINTINGSVFGNYVAELIAKYNGQLPSDNALTGVAVENYGANNVTNEITSLIDNAAPINLRRNGGISQSLSETATKLRTLRSSHFRMLLKRDLVGFITLNGGALIASSNYTTGSVFMPTTDGFSINGTRATSNILIHMYADATWTLNGTAKAPGHFCLVAGDIVVNTAVGDEVFHLDIMNNDYLIEDLSTIVNNGVADTRRTRLSQVLEYFILPQLAILDYRLTNVELLQRYNLYANAYNFTVLTTYNPGSFGMILVNYIRDVNNASVQEFSLLCKNLEAMCEIIANAASISDNSTDYVVKFL